MTHQLINALFTIVFAIGGASFMVLMYMLLNLWSDKKVDKEKVRALSKRLNDELERKHRLSRALKMRDKTNKTV